MPSVISTDGTRIDYDVQGEGPPLVLLHGGGVTRDIWAELRPHLAADSTLFVPNRRGRGDSGDADEHGLDREVADLRTILDAAAREGSTPALFGHSFGGLCALETARRDPAAVDRLVLYEPALLVGDHREGADLAARMAALVDDGERERATELFFREAGGAENAGELPFFPHAVDIVETVVRENRVVERYRLDGDLDLPPTLLLMGEAGPEHLRDGVRALHDAIPESRLVEFDGVGHGGIASAPERVAEEVRAFLADG